MTASGPSRSDPSIVRRKVSESNTNPYNRQARAIPPIASVPRSIFSREMNVPTNRYKHLSCSNLRVPMCEKEALSGQVCLERRHLISGIYFTLGVRHELDVLTDGVSRPATAQKWNAPFNIETFPSQSSSY